MKILKWTGWYLAYAFYSWALREIPKLHPDVNDIVLRRHNLMEKIKTTGWVL